METNYVIADRTIYFSKMGEESGNEASWRLYDLFLAYFQPPCY